VLAELERRIASLSAEIRGYPTPIARCDEQLTQLLEERARLNEWRQRLQEQGSCGPAATWINDGGFDAA
jgi:chromosome segregation ATPase